MLDKETKARIADYFDSSDLVDFLGIPADEIVEAFEEHIEENLEEIEEYIGLRRKDEDV